MIKLSASIGEIYVQVLVGHDSAGKRAVMRICETSVCGEYMDLECKRQVQRKYRIGKMQERQNGCTCRVIVNSLAHSTAVASEASRRFCLSSVSSALGKRMLHHSATVEIAHKTM